MPSTRGSEESSSPSTLEQILSQLAATNARLADLIANQQTMPPSPPAEPKERDTDLHPPDRFTGTERSRLRPFLTHCRMIFMTNHPQCFPNKRRKVFYTASYFDSIAQSWWEPYITADPVPAFLDNWELFQKELIAMFGNPNDIATAERNLNRLKMREDQTVAEYITDFRRYATLVGWDDNALLFQFRRGLANRLLDQLSQRDDFVTSLLSLQAIVQRLDARYWERLSEIQSDISKPRYRAAPKDSVADAAPARSYPVAAPVAIVAAPPRTPVSSSPPVTAGIRGRTGAGRIYRRDYSPTNVAINKRSY
jgi:hypothetical protein